MKNICSSVYYCQNPQICVIRLKKHLENKRKALGSWEEDNHFLWRDEQPDWGEQDVMEIRRLPPRHRVGYVPAKKVSDAVMKYLIMILCVIGYFQ